MSKHRKRWSLEEKSRIVVYYQEHGVGKTSAEFDVSATSIYKWESILNGTINQLPEDREKVYKRQLKKMQRELDQLKVIVADQTLEIKVKDALIKKKI